VTKNSRKTCKKGSQCCAIQPKPTNSNGKGDKPRPVCKNTYNKNYDSILTAQSIYSWFWFNGKPVNYKPKVLPRSQDANPIIQETTGLYGIKRKSLIKRKCRIGFKPIFYKIPSTESIDLDNLKDFDYLKKFLKK